MAPGLLDFCALLGVMCFNEMKGFVLAADLFLCFFGVIGFHKMRGLVLTAGVFLVHCLSTVLVKRKGSFLPQAFVLGVPSFLMK